MPSPSRVDDVAEIRQAEAFERRALAHERRRVLTRTLHCERVPLVTQVERLRRDVAAYRVQAIRLYAKLATLEPHRVGLRELRDQLGTSSARLDAAVNELIDDVTGLPLDDFADAVTCVRSRRV